MTNISPKIFGRIKNMILLAGAMLFTSFGASLLMLEYEKNFSNAVIKDLPSLYWWWLETITGLGSSLQPVTGIGKLIATFIVFAGLVLLGLLIAEISGIVKMFYTRKEKGNIKINYSDHVVIFGYTSLTAGVIKLLRQNYGASLRIVLITNDSESNPFSGEVDFIHDNPISYDTLRDANIHKATAAIILANDRFRDPDTYSVVIASAIEKQNTKVVTIAEIIDVENKPLFKKTQLDAFITRKELLSDLLDNNMNSKLRRIISKEADLLETYEQESDIKAI